MMPSRLFLGAQENSFSSFDIFTYMIQHMIANIEYWIRE
jgi:hypothetical protein